MSVHGPMQNRKNKFDGSGRTRPDFTRHQIVVGGGAFVGEPPKRTPMSVNKASKIKGI